MEKIIENEHGIVPDNNDLYVFSRDIIVNARKLAYHTVNFVMVETYWKIGQKIVEQQGGEERAKYGDKLMDNLSVKLTAEFGNGFTKRNLRAMRQFYLLFSNWHALRAELNWTHYRSLIRVENPKAREIYMNAAADNAEVKYSVLHDNEQLFATKYKLYLPTEQELIEEIKHIRSLMTSEK
jgi:hypothetical protein